MIPGLRKSTLVSVLALAGALTAVVPASSLAAPAGFFGVTPTLAPDNADLQRMGQARVGTLRIAFGWDELEPAPGAYAFGELDRIVAGAAQQGIVVRPFLYGTPPWARDCGGIPAVYCDRVTPLRTAAGRERWPLMIRALVARYGQGGSLWTDTSDAYSPPVLPIREWQVWNEPNSSTFLRPKATPKAYFQLLRIASKEIRSIDPGARIILGGLFGTPPRGIPMWRFLDKLYGFKKAKKLFQAVAIHPYAPNVKGIEFQLRKAREALARNKAKRAGVYLTEIGWGSGRGSSNLYKGPKGQAASLKASFKFILKNRKRYRIRGVNWFSWRDMAAGTGANCILCESFGLLAADRTPKRSLSAFTRFTGGR